MKTWMLVTAQAHRLVSGSGLNRALPTLDQIEDALSIALVLQSGSDYQYWLKLYCRKLTDESYLAKATELVHDLMSTTDIGVCLI